MIIERKKNAIKGTIFGIILKFLQMLFPFIIRTIYIHTLGVEYLGLSSFYTSILQVLNLSELGVSTALVYSMYKPIADDDKEKICQLMNLYKSYYRIIGFVILCLGLFVLPFLSKLIHSNIPSDANIYILYLMNLFATVSTYWLFAYRNALFVAHQRNDIVSIITIFICIFLNLTRVLSLIYLKNYYIDVLVVILFGLIQNIITAFYSKRYYPEYDPKGVLLKEERDIINRKIRDLFTAKISGILNHSMDSIVISIFAGLKLLAIYQNYYYITAALISLFNIFFSAITAGIGNSLITKNNENNRELLYNLNYLIFIALNFSCVSLVCLYQPFMKLWVGKANMLNTEFVFLFALFLYSEVISRLLSIFKDAGGIWERDKFRPLVSTLTNLFLNIITFKILGLYGIVLSTVFSLLFVSYPWLIINIDKYLFKIDVGKYLKKTICFSSVLFINLFVTFYICNRLINIENTYYLLISRLVICFVIPNISFIIVFYNTDENKYLIENVKKLLKFR